MTQEVAKGVQLRSPAAGCGPATGMHLAAARHMGDYQTCTFVTGCSSNDGMVRL